MNSSQQVAPGDYELLKEHETQSPLQSKLHYNHRNYFDSGLVI